MHEGVWGKPSNLRRNAKWRKTDCKLQGGVGVGRCMGVDRGYRGYGGTPGVTRNFRENSGEIPGSNGMGPATESHIVKWRNKIFTVGQKKNNPTIIPDPPTEYLRKCNLTQIWRFFPHPFIYFQAVLYPNTIMGLLQLISPMWYSSSNQIITTGGSPKNNYVYCHFLFKTHYPGGNFN